LSYIIAVDLGGTSGRVAGYVSTTDTEPTAREAFEVQKVDEHTTAKEMGRAFQLDYAHLLGAIRRINQAPDVVSLAVAGKLNPQKDELIGAGNLIHWVGRPLVERLSHDLDCPVVIGNDAEAAALAEAYHGHGQDQDFLLVIWGSGVGGCRVHWYRGKPIALPTELGHQHLGGSGGFRCGCGWWDCLEAWCGGDKLAKRYDSIRRITREDWLEIGGKMSRGVHTSLVHHPVPLVVFSGGVICKQDWLVPHIKDDVRGLLEQKIVEPPAMTISRFGEEAGTLGALQLCRPLFARVAA
jgi:predicted NBD/HSP70 family sugar kinase